jgi:hypothetical protein
MNTVEIVGYVGIKIDTTGTVQVCRKCSTASLQGLNAHSYAPVYDNDTYITNNGGMRCDICREIFI